MFENPTDKALAIKTELVCKGNKSCSFYCDEVAGEQENIMVKNIRPKENVCILIMYHSLSSLFEYKLTFLPPQEEDDKDYNHEVFNEEGEELDNEGKLLQYYMDNDDNIIIGIDSKYQQSLKLKLILEGLKISKGEFKDKTEVVFELKPNKRKVFETVIVSEDDLSFKFEFA